MMGLIFPQWYRNKSTQYEQVAIGLHRKSPRRTNPTKSEWPECGKPCMHMILCWHASNRMGKRHVKCLLCEQMGNKEYMQSAAMVTIRQWSDRQFNNKRDHSRLRTFLTLCFAM